MKKTKIEPEREGYELREVKLEVRQDYEDFFKNLVKNWMERKARTGELFKHKQIIVSTSPWIAFIEVGKTNVLDYWSDPIKEILWIEMYSLMRYGLEYFTVHPKKMEELIELM